jgi:hypothetical protein
MSDLFNRDIAVTVGTLRIAARVKQAGGSALVAQPTLRVAFAVEKSLNRDPNKAEISIYNLNDEHRKALQKKQACIIEAGYVNTMEKLFNGDLTFVSHNRETVDWVSKMQAKDGGVQYASARINKSFRPGTQMTAVLNQAAQALGVGMGNAQQAFSGSLRGGLTQFTKGVTLSGRVSDVLDKFVSSAGMEWSIQDGQLQVLQSKSTTQQFVINLSADSGMIGSPELGEKGIVKVRSLLMGGLLPGRKVKIESAMVTGFFRVEKVKHYGDTWGTDWYSEMEAKPV